MIITTIEIEQFLSWLKIVNAIELNNLERIVKTEFAQGLPSDTELAGF